MKKFWIFLIIILGSFLYSIHYEQTLAPLRPIISEGAFAIYKGEFVFKLQSYFRHLKFEYEPTPDKPENGDEIIYKNRNTDTKFTLMYGLTDNFLVECDVPYKDTKITSVDSNYGNYEEDSGIGQSEIKLRYRFWSRDSFADLGFMCGVRLPSSNRRKKFEYLIINNPSLSSYNSSLPTYKVCPLETGGMDYLFGVNFSSELERGLIVGDIQFEYTSDFENRFGEREDPGNVLKYNLGYVYPVLNNLRLTLELNAFKKYLSKINRIKQAYSDSLYIFLTPGVQFTAGENFIFEFALMWPIKTIVPFKDTGYIKGIDSKPWPVLGIYWLF